MKTIMREEFVGPWYTTKAPNGCCESREREKQTIEIYEADYYGKGPKLYARGSTRLEFDHGGHSGNFGHWDDGNEKAIARWIERIKAQRAGAQSS